MKETIMRLNTNTTIQDGHDSDPEKTLEFFDKSIDSAKDNEQLVNRSDENVQHDDLFQENSISEDIIEPNLTQDQSEFVLPSPPKPLKPKTKRVKKSVIEEDPRIQEAFDFIKAPIQNPSPSLVYAQYIANKLDTYQGQTRALVEHAIHNVFFEADMGKFNNYSSVQNTPPGSSYYTQQPQQSNVPHYSMPKYPTDLVTITNLQTTPASPYINVTSPGSKATSKAFMDRDAKRKSWIDVGMNMFENWKTFSNTEQEEKNKLKKAVFKDALLDAIANPPLFFQTLPEVDDSDKAFLLSFLPDIKKLNDQQKMELKFQFFQSLRSITTQSTSQPQNIINPSNTNS
ncbi:hypothetical protein ACI65C_012176 [Semiaphis heraclei]